MERHSVNNRKRRWHLALTALFLILALARPALADGWKKAENGRSCYYVNGKAVKGRLIKIGNKKCYFDKDGRLVKNNWINWKGKVYRASGTGKVYQNRLVKIEGNWYYFRASGARASGWLTRKGKRYYFGSDGAAATGLQKIGKYTYLFSSRGVMQKGEKTVGNTTYYFSSRGRLTLRADHSAAITSFYDGAGNRVSNMKTQDLEARYQARKVIAQVTDSSMTQSRKLWACFQWVVKKPYVIYRDFQNVDGWWAVYANDHFLRGGGNCQSDGAAFAYLARELGYKNVYVCADSTFTDMSRHILAHSWTEIGGLVYDPLFYETYRDGKYYGGSYSAYGLYAVLHIRFS